MPKSPLWATTLSRWGVLCASMILRAIAVLARANAPGRATQARKVKGEKPDEE